MGVAEGGRTAHHQRVAITIAIAAEEPDYPGRRQLDRRSPDAASRRRSGATVQ